MAYVVVDTKASPAPMQTRAAADEAKAQAAAAAKHAEDLRGIVGLFDDLIDAETDHSEESQIIWRGLFVVCGALVLCAIAMLWLLIWSFPA